MKKLLIENVTIGADVEVFLKDKKTDTIVSAEGIIQGTKHFPFQFVKDNPFYATSLDNVMAEFCIPPAKSGEDFRAGIEVALNYIQDTIPNYLTLWAFPAAKVDDRWLMTPNAQMFGCEPDYDAWKNGMVNEKPEATDGNLRSCGGHIHVGYDNPSEETNRSIIKAMDIFLGLASVLQEPDNARKDLYGKAGAHRIKAYGVEYRTISNYYVNSKELTHWAFNNTMEAINFVNAGSQISKTEAESIQLAINRADKKLAETMCKYFGVKLAA
jgi:hypothetical protein